MDSQFTCSSRIAHTARCRMILPKQNDVSIGYVEQNLMRCVCVCVCHIHAALPNADITRMRTTNHLTENISSAMEGSARKKNLNLKLVKWQAAVLAAASLQEQFKWKLANLCESNKLYSRNGESRREREKEGESERRALEGDQERWGEGKEGGKHSKINYSNDTAHNE